MLIVAFIISVTILLYLVYSIIETSFGFLSIKNLTAQNVFPSSELPSVSIIFSALNEQDHLPAALSTMLNLDYPHLEIIAINDRSTDQTGIILENFSKTFSNLRVIHIKELPENWLGKNHALYVGAKKAKGDWLLFTDADVLMDRLLLKKAMSYVLEKQIGHLTIYEKHLNKTFWLKILSLGSYASYCLTIKPWRIRYGWSKKYLGHGAFNLVRNSAYQHAGGHRAIAMQCLDDIELGKLLKTSGCKQDTVDGRDYIEREWYSSLSEMIRGLSKNSFAYFDFKLQSVARDFFIAFPYFFWPLIAVIFFSGPIFWVNVCNVFLTICFTAFVATQFRLNKMYALFYPIAILLLLYTVFYSIYLTYKYNGIYWRNTHYLLQKLRSKPVPADIIDS